MTSKPPRPPSAPASDKTTTRRTSRTAQPATAPTTGPTSQSPAPSSGSATTLSPDTQRTSPATTARPLTAPSARAVAAYLKRHPQFLARHAAVLSAVDIPQQTPSGTISLRERQVVSLRKKADAAEKKLQELASLARGNEKLHERLSVFAVHCAAATHHEHLLSTLPAQLEREFKLERAVLRADEYEHMPADDKHWFARDHTLYARVCNYIERGNSTCTTCLARDQLAFLFGAQAVRIKSCALVPLLVPVWQTRRMGGASARLICGLLALGSKDATRYADDKGTLHLDFLARIVGAALWRLSSRDDVHRPGKTRRASDRRSTADSSQPSS